MYAGAYSIDENAYMETSNFDFNYPVMKTFKILAIDINCDDGITFYMRPYDETTYYYSTNVNTNFVNIPNSTSFDLKISANVSGLKVYFIRIYGEIIE